MGDQTLSPALQIIVIFCGVLLLLGSLSIILRSWQDGSLSCGAALAACITSLIIFIFCISSGWGWWKGLLILLPTVYLLLQIRTGFNSKRMMNALNLEEYTRCRRIIARDPKNAAAHARLGELLESEKKYDEALESYAESLLLDPYQHKVEYLHNKLRERIGLSESKQIKCPGCLTIQPDTRGYCWKCGRLLNAAAALLEYAKILSISARCALIVLIASGFITLASGFTHLTQPGLPFTGILFWAGVVGILLGGTWLFFTFPRNKRPAS
jgi:hypothetical protein